MKRIILAFVLLFGIASLAGCTFSLSDLRVDNPEPNTESMRTIDAGGQ